jgi:hypothetical protein
MKIKAIKKRIARKTSSENWTTSFYSSSFIHPENISYTKQLDTQDRCSTAPK